MNLNTKKGKKVVTNLMNGVMLYNSWSTNPNLSDSARKYERITWTAYMLLVKELMGIELVTYECALSCYEVYKHEVEYRIELIKELVQE